MLRHVSARDPYNEWAMVKVWPSAIASPSISTMLSKQLLISLSKILCVVLFAIAIVPFAQPQSAIAATPICKEINNHQVCIRKIKRSAKNYWEYWALVEVDGQRRPKETYNCRDRVLIDTDNILVPFDRELAGDFVCQLYVDKQTYLERFNPPPVLSSSNEST